MQSSLKLEAFKGFSRAVVDLPGSKSITNRALILSALVGGETRICNALFSRDTEIMVDALRLLGCQIDCDLSKNEIVLKSDGLSALADKTELFVGNAGTAARFLTALVAIRGGEFSFDSDEAMYKRPIKGLIDALRACGVEFEFFGNADSFPFKMKSLGISKKIVEIDASQSSQLLSALLLVAPFGDFSVKLLADTVSKPFVLLTLKMMESFGISYCENNGVYSFTNNSKKQLRTYIVEPDATAASYFAMLPVVTSGVTLLKNLGSEKYLQGDIKFIELIEHLGLIKTQKVGGDLLVRGVKSVLSESQTLDFNDISDTFLTLAASSIWFENSLSITGLSHTRKQECDRVGAVCSELKKLCKQVYCDDDSITIVPYSKSELLEKISSTSPIKIKTYDDHRIAMSFAIALSNPDINGNVEIENPECVSKTWRNFFDVLESARKYSEKFTIVAVDGGAAVGKSSVSRESSASLNYMHIDTGAHYRTLAYGLLELGIVPENTEAIVDSLKSLKLGSTLSGNSAVISIDSKIIPDSEIRTERINMNVAKFAAVPELREFLKNYQRSMADIAKSFGFDGLIMEGRDIGSVIFPDATLRIFLDADEETRAKRRAKEGISDSIKKRDELDKNRKTAPLVCPEGAVRIDTSNMTKEEVVALTIKLIIESRI